MFKFSRGIVDMNEDRDVVDRLNLELIKQGGLKRDAGISALYRTHSNQLRRFLGYQCNNANAADIDDLVQETFIKIVRNCESYRGESSLWSWMTKIAINCRNDHFRKKSSRPTENLDDDGWAALEKSSTALQVTNESSPADTLEDCFYKGFRAFAKKEPDRAYALSLVVDEFDMKYISNLLDRTEGATRQYLSQCRKKIEEFLKPCREYLSPF